MSTATVAGKKKNKRKKSKQNYKRKENIVSKI